MMDKKNIPDELIPMWESLDKLGSHNKTVSQDETDAALVKVWSKIEHTEHKKRATKSNIHQLRRYFSAAAAILIAIGISYLFIPIKIQAPTGQTLLVNLSDESQVQLNAGSSISYNRMFNILNRDVKLSGEAYFDVEKSKQAFSIKTHDAEITVLGTQFNVDAWKTAGGTRVYVEEGRVAFSSQQSGDRTELTVNETAYINDNRISKKSGNPDTELAWLEGHFAFENTSLSQLFSELSRSYGLDIAVNVTDSNTDVITAYYNRPENPESIIRDICQVKDLSYRKTINGFIIE